MASPGSVDPDGMRFGIEAEYALVHQERGFLDFGTAAAEEFQRVVDRLPDHHDADLTRGDLAIKLTRWYVEGDERFDPAGEFLRCVPKGIETRTPICPSIEAAGAALVAQTRELAAAAAVDGHHLVAVGHNPFRGPYQPDPPYNQWELAMRRRRPEYAAADVYMRTYGPDLNLSHPAWTPAQTLDIGRKLAHYAPAVVPFSVNSPFAAGRRWSGYSARTHARAGRRPTVRVFLAGDAAVAADVHPARIPAEHGRIEFKAFDAVGDLALYPALLALLAGLALDRTLPGRAECTDTDQLRHAAEHGFDDPGVAGPARRVVDAAHAALAGTGWADRLDVLHAALAAGRTPAHVLIDAHAATGRLDPPALDLPPAAAGSPAGSPGRGRVTPSAGE